MGGEGVKRDMHIRKSISKYEADYTLKLKYNKKYLEKIITKSTKKDAEKLKEIEGWIVDEMANLRQIPILYCKYLYGLSLHIHMCYELHRISLPKPHTAV